jgi:hypothetical protein
MNWSSSTEERDEVGILGSGVVGKTLAAFKAVIDATNPIADEPPVDGVLKFFTNLDESPRPMAHAFNPLK